MSINSRQKQKLQSSRHHSYKGLIITSLIVASVAGSYFIANQKPRESQIQEKTISTRQKFLDDIAGELSLPHASRVIYDPTGELLPLGILNLAQKVKPNITMREIDPTGEYSATSGWYEAYTPEVLNLRGEEAKSPIYFGRRFFEEQIYSTFTRNDFKLVVLHEHRHAYQHAFGYNGIDSTWLLDNVSNGKIRRSIVHDVSELDANAEELRVIENGLNPSQTYKLFILVKLSRNYNAVLKQSVMTSEEQVLCNAVLGNNAPIIQKYKTQINDFRNTTIDK